MDEDLYPQKYEIQPARAQGATESERYLKTLCEKAFLGFWSYPGLFTDRKKKPGGHGKELCDLLVVSDDHVIIFSDKHCDFPSTGNLILDWSRWFRRAVYDSAKQIWGAESWIRNHPDRIFLDRLCKIKAPLNLPPQDKIKFHRVVVARNGSQRCREEMGGSGSLTLQPDILGNAHMAAHDSRGSSRTVKPFAVGQLDSTRGYVHVLDDISLDTVMGALDTITDFTGYLAAKEALIKSGKLITAAGEEELLALYLSSAPPDGCQDFAISEGIPRIVVPEGHWENFSKSPERQAKLEADRISYSWDRMIERSYYHFMNGTSQFCSHPSFEWQEKIFRFFASESRFRRRILSMTLLETFKKGSGSDRLVRVAQPKSPDKPFYVFLTLKPSATPGLTHEEYRDFRRQLLGAFCQVVRFQYPQATDIVGLAIEPFDRPDSPSSEDFIYLDGRDWTQQDEIEARKLQEQHGFLANASTTQVIHNNYPGVTYPPPQTQPIMVARRAKSLRNSLCPCGSGVKGKRCCMRN